MSVGGYAYDDERDDVPERVRSVAERADTGMTVAAIARELGLRRKIVAEMLKREAARRGVPFPEPGRKPERQPKRQPKRGPTNRAMPWLYARHGAPKGPAAYNPNSPRWAEIARDVLGQYAILHEADALPAGPRQCGYRLSSRPTSLHYVKETPLTAQECDRQGVASFKDIIEVVKRLRQAGKLPWAWVADGSELDLAPDGFVNVSAYVEEVLADDALTLDLRSGQPLVGEIYVEAREAAPLIARVALPLGVRVYSGQGSAGPGLARKAALRAMARYRSEDNQQTLLFGASDLDRSGVQTITRPHVEHVAAFIRDEFIPAALPDDATYPAGALDRLAEQIFDFRRLAITPEQAMRAPGLSDDVIESFRAYGASGENDWDRDLDLLTAKVEMEALDPVELRQTVIDALEDVLDMGVLDARREEQDEARKRLPQAREAALKALWKRR